MINVNSLTKRYNRFLALDKISFEVNKGEIVGLLGPNGAGKTTTMKILTTFLPRTSGNVSVGGFDVFEDSLKVRQMIGYLPESCPLYYDMEVTSYLKFCAEVRGIDAKKRTAAVEKVVSDCDLSKVTTKVIGHLSKGYKQRVGLAQALIHNPEVLILDEPTSGLDPNQIRDILKLIHNLGQEKTVIHSTHILNEVEATSNRVLIINEGKIVGQGTPKELMAESEGTTVFAHIQGEGVLEALKAAEFAKNASALDEVTDGFTKYAIHGHSDDSVSADVFKLAVEKNWVISELNTHTASLEDVFATLTRGNG